MGKRLEKLQGANFDPESKKKLEDLKVKLKEIGLDGLVSDDDAAKPEAAASAKEGLHGPPVSMGLVAMVPVGIMLLFIGKLFLDMQKRKATSKDKSKKKREGPK